MKTTLSPSATGRAAIDSRRVREELPSGQQIAVRCRAVRDMMFGEHWLWRNGAEYFTAAGLRMLADAYAQESDAAAALVCRNLADELDAEEAHEKAASTPRPVATDEVLAKRWDLREGQA